MKTLSLLLSFILIAGGLIYYLNSKKEKEQGSTPTSITTQAPKSQARDSAEQSEKNRSTSQPTESPEDQIIALWVEKDYEEITRIFGEWIFKSPEAALDFVANAQPPITPINFYPDIKIYLESLPHDKAMEMALRLENHDTMQVHVTASLFSSWLNSDQEASIAWLFKHKEHNFTSALAERMGSQGGFGEPSQALQWITQRDESPLRTALLKGTFTAWLNKDHNSAMQYFDTSPQPQFFDKAVLSYIDQISTHRPVSAKIWADTLENEKLKNSILSKLESVWTEEFEALYQDAIQTD